MDERIRKNSIKRILKNFPQYKLVDNIDNADLAVIYNTDEKEKFNILILNPDNRNQIKTNSNEKLTFFFPRHKNERDRRQIVINNVGKKHFMLHN